MFVKGTSDEEEALREEEERQRKLKDILGKTNLSLVENLIKIHSKHLPVQSSNRNTRRRRQSLVVVVYVLLTL